jgi:TolB-like protein/Tfp pilus assembly protein PilF
MLTLDATANTGESYLGVGLADAMITRLSGVHSLAVRPTSAVLRYSDATTDPLQAGRELGVDFVLDGRIKTLGKRIRITLQLMDVQQEANAWAEQFDEQIADALELEDSISSKVADAILPQLTETKRPQIRKRGTDNPQAFEAYLRGRYFWNNFTPETLPRALEAFQTAIALDPNYALAYVGLADFYNWAGIYGNLRATESHPRAKAAARRALELDDSLGEAYAALALTIKGADWNWDESERLYKRALELNPSYSLAHEWYSSLLVGTGRFEEGLEEIKRAEELDALSLRAMTLTAWTEYQARRYPEVIAKAQQIIDLNKNHPQGPLQLGNCLIHVGRAEEAVKFLRQGDQLMPNHPLPKYALCFGLSAAGKVDEARSVLREMEQIAQRQYVKAYYLAMAYTAVGELERAFAEFEIAFAEADPWINWFGTEPKLDVLRNDPRFIQLFKRTNNPLSK